MATDKEVADRWAAFQAAHDPTYVRASTKNKTSNINATTPTVASSSVVQTSTQQTRTPLAQSSTPSPAVASTSKQPVSITRADIDNVYHDLFGRDADTAGANYWLQQGYTDKNTLRQAITNGAIGYDVVALSDHPNYTTSWDSSLNPDSGTLIYDANRDTWVPEKKKEQQVHIQPTPPSNVTNYSVNPATMTIEGRLPGLLDSNSPVMQRAKTQGMQYANSRGLLNSSIGAEAAQNAVIDKALQIAAPDAGAYQKQQLATQQLEENARQFNTNLDWSKEQFAQTLDWNKGQFGTEIGYKIDQMTNQNRSYFGSLSSSAYNNYLDYIQKISTDPDLDGAAKDQLRQKAFDDFSSELDLYASLFGVDLTWSDLATVTA